MAATHSRTRSLKASANPLLVPLPPPTPPANNPSFPHHHQQRRLPLALPLPRRWRALAQLVLAGTVLAALLFALAGSSPTGFVNSSTWPAAHAAQDAFLRQTPAPPPTPPIAPAKTETEQLALADSPPPFSPRLDPLPRPKTPSKAPPWVLAGPKETLPTCEKIMLFTFMPWWGFASEYILYARAAAAAKRLGYTLLEDDRNWNYGRLTNYFLPRPLTCVPPSDWSDPRKAYPFHQGSHWRNRPRLRYSRVILSNLDDWTREVYLASAAARAGLRALRESDEGHRERGDRWILEEGGTLPGVFGEVFEEQAEVVRGAWRLTGEMEGQVEEVRRRVGLDRERRVAGDGEGEGEGKRGPVIALHIRLGDKASEYEHDSQEMGITNTFGNLTVYIEAAHDAYRRLIPSRYPSLSSSSSSSSSSRFSPYVRPTLLLISAEPAIPELISRIPLAGPFRLLETPPPDVRTAGEGEGEGETEERLRKQAEGERRAEEKGEGPRAYVAAPGSGGQGAAPPVAKMLKQPAAAARKALLAKRDSAPTPNLAAGYTQSAFNALPLLERIVHTQAFVRDLTVIAREADAAVVSAASNVGRLAMLIAGKDAVTGPLDSSGRALGGRIRSVDAHFYPTAYSTAVYTQQKDVEDLDHAAFLPTEQHAAEQKAVEAKRARKKEKEKLRLEKEVGKGLGGRKRRGAGR